MFLVTDLAWFAKLVNILSGSSTMSSEFVELEAKLVASIPVWTVSSLKDRLKDEIPVEKVNNLIKT